MPISQERKREAQDNAKRLQDGAQMLRNPRLLETLDEFEDNPDSRRRAAGDPRQFLRGKGVQVPDEYSVELRPDNWFLGITFNSTRIFGYDSSNGWCFFC
jgi:hypothetical protein